MDVNKIVHNDDDYHNQVGIPLLSAVQRQHAAVIKLLLENDADYTSPPITFLNERYNPFYCALESGNEKIIQLFLDHGAQLDQEIEWIADKTALLFAIHDNTKKEQLFKIAVKNGINLEHKFGNDQQTYLHLAAVYEDKSLCEFLIKSGANIHALDSNNRNVLHLAARNKNPDELIPFFLQEGADPRAIDIEGKTPLLLIRELKSKPHTETALAILENADKGYSSLMKNLRLLGLRYSLTGAAFEGYSRSFCSPYDEVACSLKNYLKKQKDLPPFSIPFLQLFKIRLNSPWKIFF